MIWFYYPHPHTLRQTKWRTRYHHFILMVILSFFFPIFGKKKDLQYPRHFLFSFIFNIIFSTLWIIIIRGKKIFFKKTRQVISQIIIIIRSQQRKKPNILKDNFAIRYLSSRSQKTQKQSMNKILTIIVCFKCSINLYLFFFPKKINIMMTIKHVLCAAIH